MYAVIRTGGKQYRVTEGDVLRIEKIAGTVGVEVTFNEVLLLGGSDSPKVGRPKVDGAKVVDCSNDCKDAVRFLVKNHATYGINPARIATLGSSAGGGLALLMPLTKDTDLPGDPELAK